MKQTKAAIVTAAGASSRMKRAGGVHKALLDWGGRPLVAHQVRCLSEAGFEPVVVTGADGEAVARATPDAATVVHNPDWREGRSRSIEIGAAAISQDVHAVHAVHAVLVVAVDQPLVPRVLYELVEYAGEPLVQPVDTEGRHGHPVLLGGESVEALRRVSEYEQGLRSLVRKLRSSGRLVEMEELPGWDLNDPEDYRRACGGLDL